MQILQHAMRRLLSPSNLVLLAISVLTVGPSGPIGTFWTLGTVPRLAYWGSITVISVYVGFVLEEWVEERLAQAPLLLRECVLVGTFTTIFAPVLLGLTALFLDPDRADPMSWTGMVFIVVSIAVVVRLLRNILPTQLHIGWPTASASVPGVVDTVRHHDEGQASDTWPTTLSEPGKENLPDIGVAQGPALRLLQTPPMDNRPALLRRLNLDIGVRVIAISVDDHYVEVHDSRGQTHRILLRLADAVAEAEGLFGLLVHRSHWVSLADVVAHRRQNGRDFVVLSNGALVPVSRSNRDALFAALPDLAEPPAAARAGNGRR